MFDSGLGIVLDLGLWIFVFNKGGAILEVRFHVGVRVSVRIRVSVRVGSV